MKSKLAICSIILMSFFTTNIFYANSNEINIFEKEPKIISRKEWKAKLPIKKMIIHEPKIITIHHSGIFSAKKINIFEKMQNLQKYSQSSEKMQNGKIKEVWADVPYHFVISGTGEIAEGREINFSGDTNTEYNPENHILIDVLGNFEEQIPTEEQINSLTQLCYYLAKKYNISVEKINAHNYYAKTDCPGKNLSKIIPQIKEKLKIIF